ncbi:MAG: hypothetical protein ACD_31C00005G0031 [uncultured bacterium]|uniref:Methyltransferase type 12 n=3 Tax=Candidatus Daviesiibacteriota TaxID=1752718 RepID=A0A0G0I3F5_9BACT|nr:MAG: hypothetical protein ACD_31C00005G0031 [uncultured bacterium]KKQ10606.1 MAG: Methyltransferase type 12 [Candidatus Daviesbacteria bacterium GW2011_GWB1_36_5]KKQ15736.1 MAG: Methyltransferase type 12 [Candidatus Daviesbacteria bacterium GW2011_GWA1_36_8]OGE17846.1 MAG: hypothetical protein A2858_03825 [Candidatus Daviesbacteria bacterium RIFCSPHIGHO2_01_FULL_36_37]
MKDLIKKILIFFLKVFFYKILKQEINKDINKIIELYKKDGFSSFFVKIRIWDSPFKETEKFVPKNGRILDLGCGDGFFSNYLAITSFEREVVGIELNKSRIKDANKGIKNTKFIPGNVLSVKFMKAEAVLLFHLLHHLPSYNDQIMLLKKSNNFIKPGGKLILVEVDKKPFLKYLFSYITDSLIVPLLFDNKFVDPKIYYRDKNEWKKIMEELGFKVKVFKLDKSKPFSHVILIGTKN